MTLVEVERFIGASYGCHDGVVMFSSTAGFPNKEWVPGRNWQRVEWVGLRGQIVVSFDAAGRSTSAAFYDSHPLEWSRQNLAVERLGVRFFTPCERCRLVTPCAGDR
jgi:hypothetical protein